MHFVALVHCAFERHLATGFTVAKIDFDSFLSECFLGRRSSCLIQPHGTIWVAVKELNLSFHIKEALFFLYTHSMVT